MIVPAASGLSAPPNTVAPPLSVAHAAGISPDYLFAEFFIVVF
jgi:hypothetical protein